MLPSNSMLMNRQSSMDQSENHWTNLMAILYCLGQIALNENLQIKIRRKRETREKSQEKKTVKAKGKKKLTQYYNALILIALHYCLKLKKGICDV